MSKWFRWRDLLWPTFWTACVGILFGPGYAGCLFFGVVNGWFIGGTAVVRAALEDYLKTKKGEKP